MGALPAKVAGVGEIVLAVPAPDGVVNDLVLAAADIAGVDRVITMGGAQAIAALAFGTASVPAVDKIVGPGNVYVTAAKRMVFGRVGIDMIAGPSEILVVCDGLTNVQWIVMDLFSQAEHDEQAQSILVHPERGFLDEVAAMIDTLLPSMERADIIRAALENRGALVEVRDLAQAVEIINRVAPEHLELSVAERRRCCLKSDMPAPSSWGAIHRKCWATTAPPQPCSPYRRYGAILVAVRGLRLSETFQRYTVLRDWGA